MGLMRSLLGGPWLRESLKPGLFLIVVLSILSLIAAFVLRNRRRGFGSTWATRRDRFRLVLGRIHVDSNLPEDKSA